MSKNRNRQQGHQRYSRHLVSVRKCITTKAGSSKDRQIYPQTETVKDRRYDSVWEVGGKGVGNKIAENFMKRGRAWVQGKGTRKGGWVGREI